MTGKIIRPAPAEIEFRNMRFLITDQPQVWQDMENVLIKNKNQFCFRMVQWTTTSSCCRTTRCPTLSVQQTSSTRQRSSLKVVNITLDITTHTHTNSSCRSYCLWVEFHGRVSTHPGDRGQVAVPGVQGVPIWSWHLYWSPLCHRPRSSSRTSRYCAYWTGHEIWGNVTSKMNLHCFGL